MTLTMINFLYQELTDYKKKMEEINDLKHKLDDQENRARRQNLRLVGFPAGVEWKDPIAFLQERLPKIIGLEDGDLMEIEHAHCTLQRR